MSGLSTPGHYQVLEELASQVPAEQAIVELGVFEGDGVLALARGAARGNGAHVYGIDPWDLPGERTTTGEGVVRGRRIDYTDPAIAERAEQAVRFSGHAEGVTLLRDFSEHAAASWTGPRVGLWVHDSDHREPAVRRDYTAWEPHLAPGGCVVFDDYHEWFPGVIRVVDLLVGRGLLTPPLVIEGTSTAVCNIL